MFSEKISFLENMCRNLKKIRKTTAVSHYRQLFTAFKLETLYFDCSCLKFCYSFIPSKLFICSGRISHGFPFSPFDPFNPLFPGRNLQLSITKGLFGLKQTKSLLCDIAKKK